MMAILGSGCSATFLKLVAGSSQPRCLWLVFLYALVWFPILVDLGCWYWTSVVRHRCHYCLSAKWVICGCSINFIGRGCQDGMCSHLGIVCSVLLRGWCLGLTTSIGRQMIGDLDILVLVWYFCWPSLLWVLWTSFRASKRIGFILGRHSLCL